MPFIKTSLGDSICFQCRNAIAHKILSDLYDDKGLSGVVQDIIANCADFVIREWTDVTISHAKRYFYSNRLAGDNCRSYHNCNNREQLQ